MGNVLKKSIFLCEVFPNPLPNSLHTISQSFKNEASLAYKRSGRDVSERYPALCISIFGFSYSFFFFNSFNMATSFFLMASSGMFPNNDLGPNVWLPLAKPPPCLRLLKGWLPPLHSFRPLNLRRLLANHTPLLLQRQSCILKIFSKNTTIHMHSNHLPLLLLGLHHVSSS